MLPGLARQREWVGILRPALLCVLELCGPFPESLASRGSAGVWDSACVWVTFLDNYPPGAVAQEGAIRLGTGTRDLLDARKPNDTQVCL